MKVTQRTTPRPSPPPPQPSRLVAEAATVERCAQDRAARPIPSAKLGKRP